MLGNMNLIDVSFMVMLVEVIQVYSMAFYIFNE